MEKEKKDRDRIKNRMSGREIKGGGGVGEEGKKERKGGVI